MVALRLAGCAIVLCSLFVTIDAFLLGVDLGSQYFKAAVVAPGKPFEVVHNQHSKRKTPTAVSFYEKVRTFGDDALASAARGAKKTPMFFPLQLGRNLTGVSEAGRPWLPKQWYPWDLGVNASGSIRFQMGGEEDGYTVEEITGHLLSFAKGLAKEAADGISVSEAVLTVPSQASFLQRRSIIDAAKIAGLPRAHLVHETSAAALQRALDLDLSGANGTRNESMVLFYNMGARHVEACIVDYRGATHLGKSTVAMNILGCGMSEGMGGHHVDMVIAQKMLAAFQAKHPKLADGIGESVRSLKKLEKEAMGAKHVLSANKEALYRVESLFEDTDFSQPIKRETMEEWAADVLALFSQPIDAALKVANVTLADLDTVEMIGGGWRIPRVQSLLSEHLQKARPSDSPALILSQHVNGDEAMATGAAFYGANSSVSFRTKKIFFTDSTPHSYTVKLTPLNLSQVEDAGWNKSVELYPSGSKLRLKRTVKLTAGFDIRASLVEDGNHIMDWELSGVYEAATGQYANLSKPLLSLKLELDSSGIVQVTSATAIFDEKVTVVLEEPLKAATGNATGGDTNASSDAGSSEADAEGKTPAEADAETADAAEASTEAAEEAAESASDEAARGESNVTGEAANTTDGKKNKTKIMKRKVPMTVTESFTGISPRPLSEEEFAGAVERLRLMDLDDAEVRRIEGGKNALEAFIYESRDKLGDDENCQTVSTEEERATISEALTGMEEWLYEDEAREANASVLEGKLEELQKQVLPIRSRAYELEQRATLPELIERVEEYVNQTLAYVEKNMTWVDVKERQGVANLTAKFVAWYANVSEQQEKLALTEEPAYTAYDVKVRLQKMQSEAQRLTKIRKIDPMPYQSDYSKYGKDGKGGYDDPRMRAFYDEFYKNLSRNGTNGSDWWKNFSNFSGFSGWNDSDYMRSYYEHAAQNFSSNDSGDSADADGAGASAGAEGADAEKTEL